jgi:hypothetical protein
MITANKIEKACLHWSEGQPPWETQNNSIKIILNESKITSVDFSLVNSSQQIFTNRED